MIRGEGSGTERQPFSLTAKRRLLLLFILLQTGLLATHLLYQRNYILDNTARILRNTTLLEKRLFETSLDAMRYQMRVVGNAVLLNHTATIDNAGAFLRQELRREWLDAVVVFDPQGDFVASRALFPLSQALSQVTLSQASFRQSPLFRELRRDEVNERLMYWQSHGADPKRVGFVMYRAVRNAQGEYLGGAVGYFDVNSLTTNFLKMQREGFDLGPGGAMAVLDRGTDAQLARLGSGSAVEFKRGDSGLAKLLVYASDSAEVHHYVSPIDGVSRMGTFLNLNQGRWVLGVGIAKRDILYGWYFQLLGATLGMLVIGVTQWLLLHYIHANALQRARLINESRQDPLTGLANRRRLDEWALSVCSLALRSRQPLCVVMLDLDHFKTINDTFGHHGGDAVLRQAARVMQSQVRASDIVVRTGGEEFIIAMPHTALDGAFEMAERLRASFSAQKVDSQGELITFTASFGVARMTNKELETPKGIHLALGRADRALYRAKEGGRNRVCIATGLKQLS